MKRKLSLGWARYAACAALLCSGAICRATTYTPTIFTDPVIASLASVNSTNGVISGGTGNGQVSLRSAIIAANAHAGADTITLPAGTYTLSIPGNDADCLIGDLDINDSVTINGAGAATTIIQGASAYNSGTGVYTNSIGDKVMGINQDGTHNTLVVSVNNVTIRWGQNTIPFNDPSFAYTGAGVDVFFTGTGNSATFTNCVFTENYNVNSYGGGVNVDSSTGGLAGGTATFTGCAFTNNRTGLWGTGLNLFADKHDVNITNCNFSGNIALGTGGGGAQGAGINIRHTNASTVTITGSTINGNTSHGSGGGIAANSGGNQTVNISNSAITGNVALNNGVTAWRGGGMSNANPATTTLTNVLIANNDVHGGTAGLPQGGGLANEGGPMIVKNCTITGNVSAGDGGGFYTLSTATTTMTNVTISNNRADSDGNATGTGGGINRSAGTVTLQNTIVDGNFKGTGAVVDEVIGAVNADFSLIGNTTGATITGANNQLNVSARLAVLATNGGPTVGPAGFTAVLQTHALLSGSPALDNGSNAFATTAGLTTDQRGTGFARILDASDANTTATADIGALEQHPSVEDVADQTINEDGTLSLTFNVGDASLVFDSVTATSSNTTLVPNLAANISLSGSGSTRTLTVNPAANQSGSTTITLTVTDTIAGTALSMTDTFVLTVNAVNDAPVVSSTEVPTLAYTENDPATQITATTVVSDVDSANLVGATVQITGNYANGQDVLAFTNQLGITGVFTPASGLMTLSGSSSVANYQIALRAVTYRNTSDNPSTLARAVTFQVDDGGSPNNLSNTKARTITVAAVNDPPVITAQNAISTAYNTARTIVFADLLVTDVDNPYPTGFSLTLSNGASYTRVGNTITPAVNFFGTLSVPAKVNDGAADSNTFNLAVTVNPDPAFVKVASSIAPEPGGGDRMSFIGNPGQTYTIQFTASLAPINWQFLGTRTADATGHYSIVDIPPAGTPMRFYRSIFP